MKNYLNEIKVIRYEFHEILAKIILATLFVSALHSVLSGSNWSALDAYKEPYEPIKEIVLRVHTDKFPGETAWTLIDGNTYESIFSSEGRIHTPETLYQDTIYVESNRCLRFLITDKKGDGFSNNGFFEILVDNELVNGRFSFREEYNFPFNCSEGLICEQAIPLNDGSELLKNGPNTWFVVRTINDTYYNLRTITSCDTKIWIYEECGKDHPTDQTGALFFSDDLEGSQAGFNQIRLEGGKLYYVRVGKSADCNEITTFWLLDLKLKSGCLDPEACNFDPVANLNGENCVYGQCQPDLAINQNVLSASVYLDSIINDHDCLITEGCLQGYGKRDIIRFTTQIENIGTADYIVGEPEEDSPLFSEDNCHKHWHYLGYAEYLLFDGSGSPRPVGFKNGFCALDFRCAVDSSYKYSCEYMGISAGCYDVYESDLLCQWIDVTDVADGLYTLVVRVNYNQAPDLFGRTELEFENNWAQVCVKLDRSSGELKLEIIDNCQVYTDCLGIEFGSTVTDCNGVCGGSGHFGDMNGDGQVSKEDVVQFQFLYLDNIAEIEPCFDLDNDSIISIYDMILLEDCVLNNPVNEDNPLHIHCDFPRSVFNPSDSIHFSLSDYNHESNSILLSYATNTSIRGVDILLSEISIDSVLLDNSILSPVHLSNGNRLSFYLNDDSQGLEKSTVEIPLARIYLKNEDVFQTCLLQSNSVVNTKNEKIKVVLDSECLDLSTTANISISQNNLEIFPNPAMDFLYIEWGQKQRELDFSIFQPNGQEVLHSNGEDLSNGKISLKDIAPGVYFIRVRTQIETYLSRFVKI